MSMLLKRLLKQATFQNAEPGETGGGEATLLEMSDEDFLNQPMPEGSMGAAAALEDKENKESLDKEAGAAAETGEAAVTGEGEEVEVTPTDAGEGKPEAGKEGAADAAKPQGDAEAGKDNKDNNKDDKPADKTEKVEKPEGEPVNYENEYKRLIGTPIKANGREVVIKNADDALQLMQMGLGFNKKMAALKPNLKLMKMLENNGLLSEEKISFLIDVEKKNPDAISKLVKDSGLDPMDLSAEKASAYKQGSYAVDDREVDLDMVLDELKGSPAYTRTLAVVATDWDAASKQVIAGQPQLLKVIHGHIESGMFDLISKEVESERLLGRLSGLSDIEAYRQIGDQINSRGGFNHLGQGSSQSQGKPAAGEKVVAPNPKKADDPKLNDKRRAASSTKPAVPSSTKAQDFNPLALSDDEFEKQVNAKFL